MKKSSLIVLMTLLIFAGASGAAAQQQNTIWMYCYVDANASIPQKGDENQSEGRFYVTGIIQMSVRQYKSINPNPNSTRYFEEACLDYFEKTIIKTAESKGEKLEESGLSGLVTNIDGPDVNSGSGYNLVSKDEVEKDRDERIESNGGSKRKIITFDWDPARKNTAVLPPKPDGFRSVREALAPAKTRRLAPNGASLIIDIP